MPSVMHDRARTAGVQVTPLAGVAGTSWSSLTTVPLRFSVMARPVPSAAAVSRNISASVMVPSAALSSPVAETARGLEPLVTCRSTAPASVLGPVFGRFSTAEPTTPQLPEESSPRT